MKTLHRTSTSKILTAAALSLSVVGAYVPAASAETAVWNVNVFGPKREVTAGIEAVSEFIKKETKGAIDVKITYGGALGPPKTIPEGVKSGSFEVGQMCAGYYPNKFPLLTVMELPFISPPNTAINAKIQAEVFKHPAIRKEMEERWNVHVLATQPLPPYEFMGTKRVASVDDMKGVKMRISGLNSTALSAFGAVPTMVTAPEAYTAIERGTIDMMGFPYAYTFGAYRIFEVSKFFTEGLAMGGFMCFFGVSQDVWKKAPKELHAKSDEMWDMSTAALLAAYQKADEKWIPIFKEKLEVSIWPAAERAKLEAGANAIWEKWVKDQEEEGRPGREMLDFVKGLVVKYSK